MAVYELTINRLNHHVDCQCLFGDENSAKRYSKILPKQLKSCKINLGCKPEDIGTHSLRKGSSSHALGLCMTINAVAVYLRAGWLVYNK